MNAGLFMFGLLAFISTSMCIFALSPAGKRWIIKNLY